MFVETTIKEGVNPPSFFQNTPFSLNDFKREVKLKSFSIISNAIKSKGFSPNITDTLFTGKMTRSSLIFSIGMSKKENLERLITIACSIELLHEASLVHDDVQDREEYRRHRPTIWKRFSVNEAINWGDFLLSLSIEPFLNNGTMNDLKLINRTIQHMLEGQNREQTSSSTLISEKEYLKNIKLKTSSLIELPIKLMTSSDNKENLIQAAQNLGIAYQIKNDLDDFLEGVVGIDYRNKISTLPFLKLYNFRLKKNISYNYKNIFIETITTTENHDIKNAIAPYINKYAKESINTFRNCLSKDCFEILRKSLNIIF